MPPFLRPGDTVGVVAPASWFPYEEVVEGLRIMREDWHLTVIEGDSLHTAEGPFAGSDELRRADIQRLFDNPEVRAVLAARGGYGSYHLVDELDLTGLRANPKWVVGFSDVTVLLNLMQLNGIVSLHGLMPRQFGDPERADSLESVRRWLFGELPTHYAVTAHPLNRLGRATGQLVGGNLTLLVNSIDTPTDVDLNGKILFIEDVGETFYSLDRMMNQLRRSGRLSGLAGMVVGQFTDMRGNSKIPFTKDSFGIIADAVAGYSYPTLFDFPAGHVAFNLTLPIGRSVDLVVQKKKARINF